MAHILVILGHPSSKSWNAALAQTYQQAALDAGADVRMLALGDISFDPILWGGFQSEQPLEPALIQAQQDIEWADHIVFVFPMWWATMPALLKGFVDRVMLPNWAFAYQKNGLPKKLLKGRTARIITTMDSPGWWYRFLLRRSLHRTFVQGILHFVGIKPVKETTIYSTRSLNEVQREKTMQKVKQQAIRDVRKISPKALPKGHNPSRSSV